MASAYHWSYSESGDPIEQWIADLNEWAGPPHKATIKFEALLQEAFIDTQARTHVITGSLKASGKTGSDFDGELWTGYIEYGGELWKSASPGPPNNPVVYAIYEMARGGEHDFFGGLPVHEEKMGQIIHELFPG